jgi:membrane fusion protein (multidrug efflux system)
VVGVERVEARSFSDELELVGQLAAEESVEMRPEVAGVVEKIHFREGERVERGAVLFTLRSDAERASLREAAANLALERDVYQRTLELARSQIAAEAELERARSRVEAAQAALERAEVELDRREIRAPFAGALGARQVSPGDRVDPISPLVQIDALDRLKLEFSLPESAVALARPGLAVGVQVAPYPQERFAGEVYFVSPTLDPHTRRLGLKAWVANAEGRLRPGLFASVRLEIERAEGALSVPESAIVFDSAGSFVWRLAAEGKAERVPVELGPRQSGRVVVRRGLEPGDTIVTAGTHKLFPGSPVRVAGEAPPVASRPEPKREGG